MATESLDGRAEHLRSLTVTTLAALAGIAAAFVSAALVADPTASLGIYPVAVAVLVQIPLLRLAGVDVDSFGAKDYLYVAFMTVSFWFVVWAILLTTGAVV
jgi:hypothetical protein